MEPIMTENEEPKKKILLKSPKTRRENAVQGTNDNSIVSKCSMASVGYVQDQYLQHFVSKQCRRAPLIHRGYYIRARTIDFLLRKFLKEHAGRKQILSLGAGFDSAYFRLKADGVLEDSVFIEIDFQDVVKRKHAVINNQPQLMDLIGPSIDPSVESPLIEISTETYMLLGVDLTQLSMLEALLKMCGVNFDTPTLLLSECVLTYMTRRCSSALIGWTAETFSSALFVMYEQINPSDAFGLFMQDHFQHIGSPLKCINAFPTLQCQKERFVKLGWKDCEAMDMNQFYNTLVPEGERQHIERLEPFDEYEEWHIKCSHYMVLCANIGECNNLLDKMETDVQSREVEMANLPCVDVVMSRDQHAGSIKRFGHSTTLYENIALTVGGFGELTGKHQRLVELSATDIVTMETDVVKPDVNFRDIEVGRMHPTAVALENGTVLLIGGRVSPVKLCTQLVEIKIGWEKQKTFQQFSDKCSCLQDNMVEKDEGRTLRNNDLDKNKKDDTNTNMIHDDKTQWNSTTEDAVLQTIKTQTTDESSSKTESTLEPGSECHIEMDKLNISYPDSTSTEHQQQLEHCDTCTMNTQPATDTESLRKPFTDSDFHRKISCIECTVLQQNGDIPCPRWRHTAVATEKDGQKVIFTYGGRSQQELALGDCHMLNVETKTWSTVKGEGHVPDSRHSHSSCMWGTHMVISGGLDCHLQPLENVYLMDINSFTWKKLSITGNLYPRYSHTSHIFGDYLVVVGGVNLLHCPPGVAIVSLRSGYSLEFPLPRPEKDRLTMLHCHTSILTSNDQILVIGGGGNCFSFGTHLNNSPFLIDISSCLKHMESVESSRALTN